MKSYVNSYDITLKGIYMIIILPGAYPKNAERSIFVTLKFENIAYFYFIR